MAYVEKKLPDGRTVTNEGNIEAAPNTFSSGNPISNITPDSPVFDTPMQVAERAATGKVSTSPVSSF